MLTGDYVALRLPCQPGSLRPPQAKTKGNKVNVGVKYAEKQERRFEPEKLREGRNIIGLQVLSLLHPGLPDELDGEVKEARRAPRSLQALEHRIFGLPSDAHGALCLAFNASKHWVPLSLHSIQMRKLGPGGAASLARTAHVTRGWAGA